MAWRGESPRERRRPPLRRGPSYEQLSAEGYLQSQRGSGTTVAAHRRGLDSAEAPEPGERFRYDFQPGLPDLNCFPRAAWSRAAKAALACMPDDELGFGHPAGAPALRAALAAHLGRSRGVVAGPGDLVVTGGFLQAWSLLCRVLRAAGAHTVGIEEPGWFVHRVVAERCGLHPVPVPVDEDGIAVGALEHSGDDAVVVTPAHQQPTGAVLSGERRHALLEWSRRTGGVVVEDDYDAEYRYDGRPVGSLQGGGAATVTAVGRRVGGEGWVDRLSVP